MVLRLTNKGLLTFGSIAILFGLINFDYTMGTIFVAMFLISMVLQALDKNVSYVFEKPGNKKLNSILYMAGAYAIFILVIMLLSNLPGLGSTIEFYSQQMSTFFSQYSKPALAGSVPLSLLFWGLLIPIGETILFFVKLPEAIFDSIGISYGRLDDSRTWAAIIISVATFTVFHVTAKGITNTQALMTTAIFGLISVLLVLKLRQAIEATLFHILTNTIAVLVSMGVVILNPYVLVGTVIVILYFIVSKVQFSKLRKMVGG